MKVCTDYLQALAETTEMPAQSKVLAAQSFFECHQSGRPCPDRAKCHAMLSAILATTDASSSEEPFAGVDTFNELPRMLSQLNAA